MALALELTLQMTGRLFLLIALSWECRAGNGVQLRNTDGLRQLAGGKSRRFLSQTLIQGKCLLSEEILDSPER